MNILMVSQDFPPKPIGGVGRHVEELTQALRKLGIRVIVLTMAKGDMFEREDDIIRAARIGPAPIQQYVFMQDNMSMLNAFHRFKPAVSFDLVHFHDYHSCLVGLSLSESLNVPSVVTKHFTKGYSGDNLKDYHVHVQDWSLRQAKHIIAVSEAVKREVCRLDDVFDTKTSVVYNGTNIKSKVAIGELEILTTQSGATRKITILQVGLLSFRKGCDISISAIKLLENLPVELIFAGEGSDREHFEKLALDLNINDRVRFVGFVEGKDLAHMYQKADIVILPSRYEGFPITVLEGLAMGKLVIASNIPSIAEQIQHGINGLLSKLDDAEDLATKIRWIYENPELSKVIQRNALKSSLDLKISWNDIAQKTAGIYNKLLI